MEERQKKTYRNSIRSEKSIIHAYVQLMQNKTSKRITVTDIVNKADLNRSTFYAHFKSAEDVRERIQKDVLKELLGSLDKNDYRNSLANPYIAMEHVIDFLKKDEEMYKMLLNTPGVDSFLNELRDIVIKQYLSDEVILPNIHDREGFEMNMRLFIGGYLSVVKDWAAGNVTIPLERCTQIMSESITLCVNQYLN